MNRNRSHWARLAPTSRSTDIETGLRASVHDPLWLLSRQWQLAEFRGADAGTPVDVSVTTERDPFTAVHLHGDGAAGAADSVPYDGGPLEPLIEREPVVTEGGSPSGRLAAEAGTRFRRLLMETGYGEYTPEDFPAALHLEAPPEAMESADRRYFRVMDGRALDGRAIYAALEDACPNLDAVTAEADASTDPWTNASVEKLPLPTGGSATDSYQEAALEFARWYLTLYDEPNAETGSAWRPTRLEYDASVTTGAGETAGAFDVSAYPGGRLDRDDFVPVEETDSSSASGGSSGGTTSGSEVDSNDSQSETPGDGSAETGGSDDESVTITETVSGWPTQINFPGMPNRRWWEFSDSSLAFTDLSADGVGLATVMILDYAVEFGADWYRLPLEMPVGSYVRVIDCTVTDTFGIELTAGPVDDDWRCFRSELPAHDEPGLLLPPTLSNVTSSDPVEEVAFGRDEMANLVFGLERVVEGPTGDPVDRTEFLAPELEIESVQMAADPDREYVTFDNPGEDTLDVSGHVVRAVYADGDGDTDSSEETVTDVFAFGDLTIGPGDSITLFSGTAPTEADLSAGMSAPVWRDADALDVYALEGASADDSDGSQDDGAEDDPLGPVDGRLIRRKLLQSPDADGAYRLATSVPPYWFPFTMDHDPADPPTVANPDVPYRLRQALLLDADSLDAPLSTIPRPEGQILDPDPSTLPASVEDVDAEDQPFWLYEEEVTRSGCEVSRRYQLARWTDGSTHLWVGRQATNGAGELASGLRFDILDDIGKPDR
ncbi:hypothetical protein ACLI4U_00615 [Natrialbaceae archaeon A-CW2]